MRTISVPVYTFEELSTAAQEKVLTDFRFSKVEGDVWSDIMIEEKQAELAEMGYPDAKIAYSGFSSQGDGASFTCDNVDIQLVCKTLKIELPQSFLDWCKDQAADLTVTRYDHHYFHKNTISAEWQNAYGTPEQFDNLMSEIEERVTEDARTESHNFYKALEKEYEWLTTDEAVKDTVCDMEFLENGELAPKE